MTSPPAQPASPASPGGTALVLAGGGVSGIAWELGVLRGIADVDPGLADRILAADTVIGTSAGAAVAAQITSGVGLDELYAAQLRPETAEIDVDVDQEKLSARYDEALVGVSGPADAGRRMGALALAAQTVELPDRLAAVAARLPVKRWPDHRRVLLTGVDTETGELTVFTRESGVTLLDAVAASCAVPGVWPPVPIDGRLYMDGAACSSANADLAAGADRVLIILPKLAATPQRWGSLDAEIAVLAPARVRVISADRASLDAFGTNNLSPATRAPAARAGRAVGAARAAEVAELLER